MLHAVAERPLVARSPVAHGILLADAPGPRDRRLPFSIPRPSSPAWPSRITSEMSCSAQILVSDEFRQDFDLKHECPGITRL